MSLFGTSASPFGSTPQTSATSQAQSSGSLFAGFGNQQSQASSAPSLFPTLGATTGTTQAQAQSASSLFPPLGSTAPAPQPQATSSLFPPLNTSKPDQQPPVTTAGGGLFGASTSQPTASTGSGLFGSLGSSAAPLGQTTTGSSLFGGQAPSQPQQSKPQVRFGDTQVSFFQKDSVTGASALPNQGTSSASTAQSSQPAYFDHLLERGKKRQGEANGELQRDGLPSLQLGLGDIARKIRSIGGASQPSQTVNGTQAHYLLAASGVSTGSAMRHLKDIENQSVRPGVDEAKAAEEALSVDRWIAGVQARSTQELITEGLEQSKRDFDAFLEDHIQIHWDEQRRKIYEHFGLSRPGDVTSASMGASTRDSGSFARSGRRTENAASGFGSFGKSGLGRSVIGSSSLRRSGRASVFSDVTERMNNVTSTIAVDDRTQRERQELFADKVRKLNESRLKEEAYPLLHQFCEVESQSTLDNSPYLPASYQALIDVTNESKDPRPYSEPGTIKERHFARDYLNESSRSVASINIQKRILQGSQKYLERRFLQDVEAAIARNPKETNLGGVPSSINKIRAYVRLRATRKELGTANADLQMIGSDYCWVLLYHLLRGGLVKEAAEYVQQNERAMKSIDRNFPQYISQYAQDSDRRLSPELQARLNAEYVQRSKLAPENSIDPYRLACCKIIGRCELSKRSIEGVREGMEDWLWLQFVLAREVNRAEETAAEVFGLEDIRATITEIGQRHFSQSNEAPGNHATLFFLQILSGLFEQAVAQLFVHNPVSATHFAIALDYYGLLRVSDFSNSADLLSYTSRQEPQISFGKLVGYYTMDFRMARPVAATDYLVLICLNSDLPGGVGQAQAALCHEALRELVLETREYAALLGDLRMNGQRIVGAIEQRMKLIRLEDEKDFSKTVTLQAASLADESGRVTDAVLLNHLAEEFDAVIAICNRALSEAISLDIGQEHMRLEPLKPRRVMEGEDGKQDENSLSLTSVDDPAELARRMLKIYSANTMLLARVQSSTRDTCAVLLGIHTARTQLENGEWMPSLDTIKNLDLLPLMAGGDISVIRAKAQAFNSFPPLIARNIGNMLMWTITACGHQREHLRKGGFLLASREGVANQLLTIAKDCMVYAGLIRYKLPASVFDVLARAGQDLGA